MQVMQLTHPGPITGRPLVLVERPDPRPAPGDLLVKVTACGVCRTDLQLAEGDLRAKALPIVPGHQVVGRVVEVGVGVSGWRAGDRVGVAWLGGTCGACARCREGRENLCGRAELTGWDRDGGFATHVVVHADYALRLPDGFDDFAAAPLLCGGVVGYRSLKLCGIRPGGRLGLYGFGASALLAIQIARSWGCRVFVCTRSDAERTRALSMGAEWAGSYEDPPPERLDAAITFAPAGAVVHAALHALDRGGTVAVNAIHLDRVPGFSYDALWWERNLRSVANYTRADAQELLDLAARLPLRTTYEVYSLPRANDALIRLKAGKVGGAAVLSVAG